MSVKKLSTLVTIACDSAPGNFQQAVAIRSVLETFGLQVYFLQLLHQQSVMDFLAGDYPNCDYVIWFFYGSPGLNGEEQLDFQVVHQKNNDYTNKSGWKRVQFSLTPSNVSQYVKNSQGILICGASSGENWAKAFLSTGYKAYIGPTQPDLACNSYTLFITGFFYHLLIHTLDYTEQKFTPQESVIAAALTDKYYEYGTKLFNYYQ
jgi:hypothetical protein